MLTNRIVKSFLQFVMFLYALTLTLSVAWAGSGTVANANPKELSLDNPAPMDQGAASPGSRDLLQYRSGKHIMGFMPDKVYLAFRDHALRVEFIQGSGNKPLEINASEMVDGQGPKTLGRVVYKNLWPGITLQYDKVDQGIAESTYTVQPGADISRIQLKYNVPVTLLDDGTLMFRLSSGAITETAPLAWQDINGKRQAVEVAFRVKDGTVGFQVGAYDRSYALVIDPTYQWHTFYASNTDDYARGIAVDGSGNVYVAGHSATGWNGPVGQPPLNAFNAASSSNMFVLKLDSAGAYQWHTFYGSNIVDYARGIATDSNGNVYVTGWSTAGWNGPTGQYPLNAYNANDIFVLKLDSHGAYQWHAFYGGSGTDYAFGTAIDTSGNVYVTGQSGNSWNGPAAQAPLHAYINDSVNAPHLFILKIASNGNYQWHTFYGSGGDYEYANGIAIDGSDHIYVTGHGGRWTGPAGQAPLHAYSGSNADAFILKLDSSGTYQWHTYYGGKDDYNYGFGIAIDGDSVYVGGSSSVSWKGPGDQSPLNAFSGYYSDIFVLKLNSGGAYQWHTFYGADGYSDGVNGMVKDRIGNVYVTGYSGAGWNGPSGQAPANAFSGTGHFASNLVLLKLDSSGAYQWHTFHGSGNSNGYGDTAYGIAIDANSNLYAAGNGYGSWTGQGGASPLNAFRNGSDAFILKVSAAAFMPTVGTANVTDITTTSATGGGAITSDGEAPITDKGVCWGASPNPTLADTCTSGGTGSAAFAFPLYGLTRNTLYHIRAYAKNAVGTTYGSDVTFTTAACTVGDIAEYTIPTVDSYPYGMTAGPDGNLWFTEVEGNKIGRITPEGVITEFSVPTPAAKPRYITTGPDGNLWFTESYMNKIGKITTAGVITEYPLPPSVSIPFGITTGPDGNLWFTAIRSNHIGRITTAGRVSLFTIPTADSNPYTIITGPDGNLWFTESTGNTIGKITTGGVITEYPLPASFWMPNAITAGPDGNLWFAEGGGIKIGKMTTSGVYTEYQMSSVGIPGITTGPDGNLWFTSSWGNQIGQITTAGAVATFSLPHVISFPQGITPGPDGSIWFTEYRSGKIGKISTCAIILKKGDINGDGIRNLADAILAIKVLSGMKTEGQNIPASATVSSGGKIGLAEVIYILQTVAEVR